MHQEEGARDEKQESQEPGNVRKGNATRALPGLGTVGAELALALSCVYPADVSVAFSF